MGGAQPLAATMNEGAFLAAEVDETRIDKRLATRYLDEKFTDLDAAIDRALALRSEGAARSVGVVANAADLLARLLERQIVPDILTDQTSAHDELNGYVPNRMALAEALKLRRENPERYKAEAYRTMAEHMRSMLELQRRGAVTFDYGNNLRGQAIKAGVTDAFQVIGFVPLYIRPLFCAGQGPVPLGGAFGSGRGHSPHRPGRPRDVPGGRGALPVDPHGPAASALPGASRPYLLARVR